MDFNAQDIMDQNNNRQETIDKLIAYCMDNGLDYSYTDKSFTIKLVRDEPLPKATERPKGPGKRRKGFDIDSWGPKGYVEGEEPDPEQPLEEGKPPKEQL